MGRHIEGGAIIDSADVKGEEYLPNRGVFLAGLLGRARGDGFGLYRGRIEPGKEIAREVHEGSSETVYILAGRALGFVGDQEVPLEPGQVMHVEKNTPHGLRNVGDAALEFLVIGHPDF
jgi:mannose-6-phosphate isomerase-like protein (cupin superfamily)